MQKAIGKRSTMNFVHTVTFFRTVWGGRHRDTGRKTFHGRVVEIEMHDADILPIPLSFGYITQCCRHGNHYRQSIEERKDI